MTPPIVERAGRARLLLASSTVALVLGVSVAVLLHESSHAVAGLLRGYTPTLYADAVDYSPEPDRLTRIVTAATGPVFSLVLGLAVFALGRSVGRGFVRLFLLWLGLVSMQNFFGYLLIAPFAGVGDTGQVMGLLEAPGWAYVVVGVLGAVLTVLNARLLAGQVIRYAAGRDELRHTVLFPWLIGTAILVALTPVELARAHLDPGALPVIMAGAVSSAIFAPMFTFFYRRLRAPYERLDLRLPWIPLAVLVVLEALVIIVVAPGIRLG